MADDENKRLTAEERLPTETYDMAEEERATRAALREASRHITRSSLFEGITETGERAQLNLASVVATFETTRYFQVNLTAVTARLAPEESERFREALREWMR
jgi:hypothetical protein